VLAKQKTKYIREVQFVEHAFYYIHKKLLKNYEQYASISETIATGKYDCVTASTVYSVFLMELNISFSVIETNYYMYILVYPNTENEILLETADPLNGFNSDKQNIEQFNLGDKSAAKQLAKETIQYYSSSRISSYLHFLNGSPIASN